MSNTPSTKSVKDTTVPVNASGSLHATVAVNYGCPQDPDQCTCSVGTVTLDASAGAGTAASASLRAAAGTDLSCMLSMQVTTRAAVNGDVVVRVVPGSINILIPEPDRNHPVRGLSPSSPQLFTIPFSFVGTGTGLIDISLQVGTQTANMPQMRVVVG